MAKQRIITEPAQVSFPHLFEPHPDPGGRLKYSVTLVFKGGKGVENLKKAAEELVKEKFNGKIPPRFKWPFRDGAEYADKAGFEEGDVFIAFSRDPKRDGPPSVCGPDRTPLEPGHVYPGCIGRVGTRPFVWHHKESNKHGVSFSLDGFQFVRDGEPLGDFAPFDIDEFDDGAVTVSVED